MASDVSIKTEFTPNPDSLKFNVSVPLCGHGTVHFASAEESRKSPLAAELFKIAYVKEVMIGPDHVTVTRNEKAETWGVVIPLVTEVIKSYLSCGKENPKRCDQCADVVESPRNETERQIVQILEEQIRPALVRDGGDVVFCGFEGGIVKLQLKGACAGCPSATMTLKHGIEAYLKEYIPEVKEVVRV